MKKTNKMIMVAYAILIASTTLWFTACQKEKDPATPGASTNLEMPAKSNNTYVFPVQSHMYGKTYADWGVELFKWQFQFDTLHSPYLDATGAFQNQNQSGDVFFLGGAPSGATNRTVTVPAGKSLLVPVIYYFANTGCGETRDQLIPDVQSTDPLIAQLALTIDGNVISNIGDYLSVSGIFSYTANSQWNSRFCLDGTVQDVVMSGYWVMLKPLSSGTHVIHTEGGVPVAHFSKQITWTINQQ